MANTTNFNWETPDDTDLLKDGAAAIRTLGSSIDTSFVDLKGGTTGQILSKASNTDLDYTWIANDQGDITEVSAGTGISVASGTGPVPVVTNTVATTFDAKGDLVVGTGADTFAKLTVGTNGYTLVADSAEATGLKWAAPSGDWVKITEIVNTTTAAFSFTSIPTTYRHLVLMMAGRSNQSSVWGTGFLRFNNDSGNNYDWECAPDGVNAAGTTGAGQSYAAPFAPVANTATANNAGSFTMFIPNYKGTTFFKSGSCVSGAIYNTTAADFKTNNSTFLWRSTAAINRIDIDDAGGGGGFLSGSVCTLYGVM